MKNRRVAKALVVTLALVGAMGLGACGDDSDSSGPDKPDGIVYQDPQGRFSMTLPKDWIQDRSGQADANIAFVATQPDTSTGQPFTSNIRLEIAEDISSGLDQAARALRDGNASGLPAYDPNTDERLELADGTDAYLIGGIYQQEGLRLQTLKLLVTVDGIGYTIEATNPVRSFREHEQELRASLLSFDPG